MLPKCCETHLFFASLGTRFREYGNVFSQFPGCERLGKVTISTDGLGSLVAGSVEVEADNNIGGVIRFQLPGIGIAGIGQSQPFRRFLIPVRRQLGGINTGVAIHSLADLINSMTLKLRDVDGVEVATAFENLPAQGHLVKFIDELFPNVDTDDFQGTLVVEVIATKVAATALELGNVPGQFTALPVMPIF